LSRSKKKAGLRMAQFLSGVTGMPLAGMTNLPILTCLGSLEIRAEGCQGILEYSDARIQLDMGEQRLTVTGSALKMEEFRANCLTIHGQIEQILWEAIHV